MTEKNQVWVVFKRYMAPLGVLQRIESIGVGIPDVAYCLRTCSGWVELKLGQAEGRRPACLTLDQVLWGEAWAAAAGGLWHLLVRVDDLWLLYDAPGARALYEGSEGFEPLVRVRGRFPLRELLDHLAPVQARGMTLS